MDTELISVETTNFGGEQVQTVKARTLYEFLGARSSNYLRWCVKHISGNEYAIDGVDYILNPLWEESRDYDLSIDFAKRLSMMAKTPKWEEVRQYFLNIEKAFKRVVTPQIPQTFAQALLLASKQAEEIEALEEMRAINAPLVEFAKTVQTSETDISVEQFAKATFPKFGLGRNTMFKKLRELGFLKGDNLPYQQYVTQGLFRVIETVKFDRIFAQTLITGKGQVLLEGEIV